MMEIREFV